MAPSSGIVGRGHRPSSAGRDWRYAVASSRRASDTSGVTDVSDMRARYEHALAEITEMKGALAERARHVAELEQRLMRQVEEGAREKPRTRDPVAAEPTKSDLARAVAAAEAEKALAQAERDRLDERERNIRRVERELAGLRVQLDEEWKRLASSGSALAQPRPADSQTESEPPPPTPLPQPSPDPELDPAAAARQRTTKPR